MRVPYPEPRLRRSAGGGDALGLFPVLRLGAEDHDGARNDRVPHDVNDMARTLYVTERGSTLTRKGERLAVEVGNTGAGIETRLRVALVFRCVRVVSER